MRKTYFGLGILCLSFPLAISQLGWTAASCNNAQTGFSGGSSAQSAYSYTPLGTAHMLLKFVNSGFANVPKDMMCHFTNDMGMPTTGLILPFDKTKVFNGNAVELTVNSPTETFAFSDGYALKGSVNYGGARYMNLWWGGSGTLAAGFLNTHDNGFDPTHPLYLQFDLTNPAAQTLKIWAVTEATAGSPLSAANDMNMYGRFVYNSNTNAIQGHMMGVQYNSGGNICYRMVLNKGSTVGSNLVISFDQGGSLTSSSSAWSATDNTGFTSVNAVDSTATTSGTAVNPSITLDYSCASIQAITNSGKIFAGGDTSDSQDPSVVFPN